MQIYDNKRKKIAFLRRFHPSRNFLFSSQEKNHNSGMQTLKNLSKYCFFPHQLNQNKKEIKSIASANILEKESKSPFFKRKEFQKKPVSFRVLVQGLINEKNNKKNKVTQKV